MKRLAPTGGRILTLCLAAQGGLRELDREVDPAHLVIVEREDRPVDAAGGAEVEV